MIDQLKERPILFSAPMVRAILGGSKTQTRRVIKPQPPMKHEWLGWITSTTGRNKDIGCACWQNDSIPLNHVVHCPYEVGMKLWVRETWATFCTLNKIKPSDMDPASQIYFRADPGVNESHFMWRPSIFMPRWASRITLEIVNIRVERVQDITYLDAIAEGVDRDWPEKNYHLLWDRINAKRGFGWHVNPWVWVVKFKTIRRR